MLNETSWAIRSETRHKLADNSCKSNSAPKCRKYTDQSNGSTLLLWGNCDASINKSTLISCLKASKMLSCFCGVRSVWCQRLRLLPKPVTSSSTWEISWHTWQPRDNLPTHHYLCLVIWSTLCLLETRFVLGNSSHTYLFCLGILPGEE